MYHVNSKARSPIKSPTSQNRRKHKQQKIAQEDYDQFILEDQDILSDDDYKEI